jgi:hypothetical protein
MLGEGKQAWPDPLTDLQAAVPIVRDEYLRAKCENYPEERLQLLRNYLDEAYRRNQTDQQAAGAAAQQQQAAQPPQQQPQQMPQGAGGMQQ